RYSFSGIQYIYEPVYAVACAFIESDAMNLCGCAALPLDDYTNSKYSDVIPISIAPATVCPAEYNANFWDLKLGEIFMYEYDSRVQCRAGMWIFSTPQTSDGKVNSWE
ncbi:hypothetical protein PFISCL1PPCAC_9407, partial [Pristionchus fissidentatus]